MARASLDRASKIVDRLAKDGNPRTERVVSLARADILLERARILNVEGKLDDASSVLQASLDLLAKMECSDCYAAGKVWHELGRIQASRGKPADAETALRRALEILDEPDESGGDREHEELLAAVLEDLASTRSKRGKGEEARTLLDRARVLKAGGTPAEGQGKD